MTYVDTSVLVKLYYPETDSNQIAKDLSRKFTSKLGVRSLDILHVAHAIFLKTEEFCSLDIKQIALVKAVGLKIIKLLT
ncbi:hypothetical protein [Leptospira weilii]|uniref:hypothetical protein n=1 Tax=Leptospira weilii TaxID=28184 RepID=UPI0009BEC687|nr:hypothetical protein [Leptospira weilii]